MRFGILGGTQAWSAAGDAVGLGGPGRRAVLALLALDAGRIVSVQRLVDGLYGEEPPAAVGNALQSQISRLRSALRAAGKADNPGQPELIENHPAGYRLAVDRDRVDAHRFARLAAEGRDALSDGDAAKAGALLTDALDLWRGPALADVADAPFAGPQIVRLEELRLTVTEDRAQAALLLGRQAEAVGELRELVAAHPLRERLTTLLVRALQQDGRQAEALAAYARTREALAEALGADPGPELAEAHLAVLRGKPSPVASSPVASSAGPRPQPTPRHLALPAQLNGLIGRDHELALIDDLLRDGRLLTLTGPGGTGKTRIAVETAGRHPGDSCFVDLSGFADGRDLPQAVLSALGLRGSARLGQGDGPPPQARLTAALTDRPLLLVLDNCEHLIADAARFAADLLADCPELLILATSREALGITGERLLPLPPLPEPAAVRLFAERATAVQPGFDPDRDAAAVAEICHRLDGLPLAIELAAARLRMLSPRQIADRLDDRFRLLTGGSRTAQPRQQTLRAVVDWSWDLLPEAERTVLRRAAVFSGGWTLEAAEAVCGGAEALDLLGSLVDKSLVIAQYPDTPEAEPRYRLLQTVRAYAAERLAESGEQTQIEQAHLRYFLDLAAAANPRLRTADQLHWLHRLAAENDNLHAALHRADTPTALRMIGELSGYWLLRGLRFEGAPHARRVLDALGPHPLPGLEEEYAISLMLGILTEGGRQDLAEHLAVGQGMMSGFARTPRRNPALTLLWAPFSGVPDTFEDLTADEIAQWHADPWYLGLMHVGEGFRNWYVTGDSAAAEREFNASIEAFRGLGDRWGSIIALTELANVTDLLGDQARSRRLSAEALRMAEELGATEDTADLYCGLAERALRAGDLDAAQADCERAIALFQHVGVAESIPRARLCLAAVARLRGDLDEARAQCATALAVATPGWYGGVWLRIQTLVELARIAVTAGDSAEAHARFRDALPPDVDTRNLPALAEAAASMAGLALLDGTPEQAARLQGVSRALRHSTVPADPDQHRITASARAALGDPGYDRAHALGADLDPESAVAALLEAAQQRPQFR